MMEPPGVLNKRVDRLEACPAYIARAMLSLAWMDEGEPEEIDPDHLPKRAGMPQQMPMSEKGSFRSLGDAWADTMTPRGRLMLTVLGGLAEFERELIRARTGEGRERAKARGVHMGRPPNSPSIRRKRRSNAVTRARRRARLRGCSVSRTARFRGLRHERRASSPHRRDAQTAGACPSPGELYHLFMTRPAWRAGEGGEND